jgi:N-acetylglucosaminyldiphosphoundecaprenol N-acetyl-beta-D-mannosaminyltransferase
MSSESPHSLPKTQCFDRPVHCILGLPFDAVSLPEAVARVRRAVQTRAPLFISTPNLNFLITSQADAAFRQSVIQSDLSLADGMPIIWLAKLLGIPIAKRVAGSTLFEELRSNCAELDTAPIKVYFFGGPDGAAHAAAQQLNATSHPHGGGMRCVGYASPGFGSIADMSTPAIIDHINAAQADFVVVALGAAKGQAWIQHNRALLNAPVISHLGAVMNFVAGTVTRAPTWVQRCGLEWLWRIKEEPSLWRRYWGDGIGLLKLLFCQVLPQAWRLRALAPSPASLLAAVVLVEEAEQGSGVSLKMNGAWTAANLHRLIPALRAHAASSALLTLDCTNTTYADSRVAGALNQLYGYRTRMGLPTYFCAPVFLSARSLLSGAVPLS